MCSVNLKRRSSEVVLHLHGPFGCRKAGVLQNPLWEMQWRAVRRQVLKSGYESKHQSQIRNSASLTAQQAAPCLTAPPGPGGHGGLPFQHHIHLAG